MELYLDFRKDYAVPVWRFRCRMQHSLLKHLYILSCKKTKRSHY